MTLKSRNIYEKYKTIIIYENIDIQHINSIYEGTKKFNENVKLFSEISKKSPALFQVIT